MINASAQRQHMVLSQLYTNDIIDQRILSAMAEVAREPFLPEPLQGAAYVDDDLEIASGRWAMSPLTFALLLDLAQITPACRVLNIGCLTGYSAIVASRLAGHVVAIDTDAALLEQARAHMKRLGIANASFEQAASLAGGYPPAAPYDVIIISGAIGFIPETVGAQLAVGGRLAAIRNIATRPGVSGRLGKGLLVERIEHRLQFREHFDASAMLLPGFERAAAFTF